MGKRLLYIGDSPDAQTGFARITANLLDRLTDDYGWECHVLGVNDRGFRYKDRKFHIHSTTHSHGDPYGFGAALPTYEFVRREYGPIDALILSSDLWVIGRWRDEIGQEIPTILYTPVDAEGYTPRLTGWVNRAVKQNEEAIGPGRLVLATYANFSRMELLRGGVTEIEPIVIPLGVDRKVYYPGGRARARAKFGVEPDRFIVLNANRNQPRKRIDITIKGFVRFAASIPDPSKVQLWLHMAPREPRGWDVKHIFARECQRHGIEADGMLRLTAEDFDNFNCLTESDLADVYRASNVVVNTGIGEGFGLTHLESAACGIPQIVGYHSALKDLWGDGPGMKDGASPFLLGAACTITDQQFSLEHVICDEFAFNQALHCAYACPAYLEEWAKFCYDRACELRFDWDVIAAEWATRLAEITGER